MSLQSFIRAMPKVELHVHLAGTIRPATLVALAERYGRPLPEPELETEGGWPPFKDFLHFVAGITGASGMIRSADDIELIAREFMEGQAAQNVVHTEVTFTAYGNFYVRGIPVAEQLAALDRALPGQRAHLASRSVSSLTSCVGDPPKRRISWWTGQLRV